MTDEAGNIQTDQDLDDRKNQIKSFDVAIKQQKYKSMVVPNDVGEIKANPMNWKILNKKLHDQQPVEEERDSDEEKEEKEEEDNEQEDNILEEFKAGEDYQKYMKDYITKYGNPLKVPGMYILDTKVFPKDKQLFIQLVKYVIPSGNINVNTVFIKNQDVLPQKIDQVYKEDVFKSDALCLRLVSTADGALTVIKEIALPKTNKAKIYFSPDGTHFCFFYQQKDEKAKKVNMLNIHEIKHSSVNFLARMLDQIKNRDSPEVFGFQFNNDPQLKRGNRSNKNFLWDKDSKYLVNYSKDNLCIISTNKDKDEEYGDIIFQYELDLSDYKEIVGLQIAADENIEEGYRIDIACLIKNKNSIVIFNLHEELQEKERLRQIEQLEIMEHEQKERDQHKKLIRVIKKHQEKKFNPNRSITFINDDLKNLIIGISQDFSKVVYGNQEENYLLIIDEDQNGNPVKDMDQNIVYVQSSLSWLNNKNINYIIEAGPSEFMLVSSKQYDRDLDVQSTFQDNFKMSILRKIEPNSIKIFDVYHPKSTDGNYLAEEMVICSCLDEQFYYDLVSPRNHKINVDNNKEDSPNCNQIIQVFDKEEIEGFDCTWPYFCFKDFTNFIYIIDANKKNIMHRIQLNDDDEDEVVAVPNTYITETLDLFMITETKDKYNIVMIDLDKYGNPAEKSDQIFELQHLFSYSKTKTTVKDMNNQQKEVELKPIYDFHVRSSSDKQTINLNKRLQAFILHGDMLYTWAEGKAMLCQVTETKNVRFERLDDENLFLWKNAENGNFQLMQLSVMFSTYEFEVLYEEKQDREAIKYYGYDYISNTLILLKRSKIKKGKGKIVSIIDLTDQNVLYSSKVEDSEIIGRLKTSNYLYIDGHIYYNNHCIKIRFDLLRDKKGYRDYTEHEIFDYYNEVLKLDANEEVQIGMPMCTPEANRMIYITKNKKSLSKKQVYLLPYLHDRKILLNKTKKSTDYFYTAIKQKLELKDEDPVADQKDKDKQLKEEAKQEKVKYNINLVILNITDHKYYVYTMDGLLSKRYNYSSLIQTHGTPIAVSNNGQVFVFGKSTNFDMSIFVLTANEGFQFIKKCCQALVNPLIKQIKDYNQKLIDYHTEKKNKVDLKKVQDIKKELETGNFSQCLMYRSQCKIVVDVNDQMDVMMQIVPLIYSQQKITSSIFDDKPTKSGMKLFQKVDKNIKKRLQETGWFGSMFYFQRGSLYITEDKDGNPKIFPEKTYVDINAKGEKVMKKYNNNPKNYYNYMQDNNIQLGQANEFSDQSLFITTDHVEFKQGLKQFSMDTDHVYFWNEFSIWHLDINTEEHQFHKLGLYVDKHEKQSKIKRVRTSSDPHIVSILVRQSKQSDMTIFWDVEKDNEIESFDTSSKINVFWDGDGNPYATEEDKVIIGRQGVTLKCYDVSQINQNEIISKAKDKKREQFGFHKGHKMDENGHSWILLREYISLSFSYMTFVINNKIKQLESHMNKNYLFDKEQYNFIIEKHSFLHDVNLINDHQQLNYILNNFNELDPVLLDQIQYYYTVTNDKGEKMKVTPLHLAWQEQNNKSINILLKFMAKLDYSQFKTFKDLWPDLISYDGFIDFMTEQTFQTIQMQNKQTLRVGSMLTDTIVGTIVPNSSSYVDEAFFEDKEKMGEQKQNQEVTSYPVKVVALEIGWLIQDFDQQKDGYMFLKAIAESQNDDLYDIESIQIIIEYLYGNYKDIVKWWRFPFYILHLGVFLLTTVAHYLSTIYSQNEIFQEANMNDYFFLAMGILNIVFCCFQQGYWLSLQLKNNWDSMWKSMWAYLDVSYLVLNLIASIYIILSYETKQYTKEYRYFSSALALVIWFKSIYYLRLNDEIASLIRIIANILWDIKEFMITLVFAIFAGANAFYLIGQNQIEFDHIPADATKPLYTRSFLSALEWVYLMAMGEIPVIAVVGGASDFDLGDGSHKFILWFFFILLSFFLIVHMLNMLIAIMGNTFAEVSLIADQSKMKAKLEFVIDHFYIKIEAIEKNKNHIQYLICAIFNEEDEDDVEILNEVQEDVWTIMNQRKAATTNIMTELKKIKMKLNKMENQQN